MNNSIETSKNQYYTNDHEWIDYQGTVAYIGVCDFKLTGLKSIQKIEYTDLSKIIRQGEVLATIFSDDYQIPIHMPVSGRVIENNKKTIHEPGIILQRSVRDSWLAKIVPLEPYSREGLLTSDQYLSFKKKNKIKK